MYNRREMKNSQMLRRPETAVLVTTLAMVGIAVTWALVARWLLDLRVYAFWLETTTAGLIYTAIGALILSRQPGHAIGRLFAVLGLSSATQLLAGQYATTSLAAGLPGGSIAAWLAAWVVLVTVDGFMVLMLLFPTGRLPSPRWRPVAWLVGLSCVHDVTVSALRYGPLGPFPMVDNPFGILDPAALRRTGISIVSSLLLLFALLASFAAPFIRMRSARGQERQQLKWFAFAGPAGLAIILAPTLVLLLFPGIKANNEDTGNVGSIVWALGPMALPVAATIAIVRYRLYDIDLIIRRTLVYSLLTVVLVTIYLGSVLLLQQLFRTLTGQTSDLAIIASTLGSSVMFNPLRWRIQDAVDRRFYRRKYDPGRVLDSFGSYLRDEVDRDRLSDALLDVVNDTLHPAHASLWLRGTPPRPR